MRVEIEAPRRSAPAAACGRRAPSPAAQGPHGPPASGCRRWLAAATADIGAAAPARSRCRLHSCRQAHQPADAARAERRASCWRCAPGASAGPSLEGSYVACHVGARRVGFANGGPGLQGGVRGGGPLGKVRCTPASSVLSLLAPATTTMTTRTARVGRSSLPQLPCRSVPPSGPVHRRWCGAALCGVRRRGGDLVTSA